jgi:hypothetical protein
VKISEVFKILNLMQSNGIIGQYAVGGAVGATFYLEPINTLDVDIFFTFKTEQSGSLINLQPIFDFLKARGCTLDGEYILIGGWPVQFLPPTSSLVEEALAKSVMLDVDGIPVSVFSPEHLAAIALQTGRTKDKARLLQFLHAGVMQLPRFETILERHELTIRWREFKQQFINE